MQAMKVKWNVRDVLAEAKVEGNALVFAQEYDRKIYEETKKVLEAIGGQWNRQRKAFLFPGGEVSAVIGEIVQTGEATRVVPADESANDPLELEDWGDAIPLSQFVADFSDGLMQAVAVQNPPVYDGSPDPQREQVMDALKRQPFPAQREVVQAVAKLLVDADEDAAVINGEMGTGKTMMAIAVAAVLRTEGYRRALVISPPHLVYKWRREILETIPNARVWVLNGPDTLRQLLAIRASQGEPQPDQAEFYVIGRVRMRMGFDWVPAIQRRKCHQRLFTERDNPTSQSFVQTAEYAACPDCGTVLTDAEGTWMAADRFLAGANEKRQACPHCGTRLWTLKRPGAVRDRQATVKDALCQLPTIGPKTADKLMARFGADTLGGLLADNPFDFINLMDDDGEMVFGDRQAHRMERSLATQEFAFGQGGYQATEFVKRYLPQGFFDLLVVDEGHEYKNDGSAQGQAMGVLAAKCRKAVLLTGTLMGGYADDLFFLLWRVLTRRMIEEMKAALAKGDKTLLGVVLNVLLAWPDCAFRDEAVKHPRTGDLLAFAPTVFGELEPAPKELELIRLCREQKAQGRKVLVYSIYSGTRDTTQRVKNLLQGEGFKSAVLRSSVDTSKREDWILEQVDRGIDVLICNPELVKTGLDLLDFPCIVFLQSGYNVYTVQQASRRSWRIGQKHPVEVFYLGYAETAQIDCLRLMAKKIAVSQSTSGDMPDTGLDVLNQDGDSLEVELAKRLIA